MRAVMNRLILHLKKELLILSPAELGSEMAQEFWLLNDL